MRILPNALLFLLSNFSPKNMMKTVLITGGARRIGAQISQTFHAQNYRVMIHYNHSKTAAQALQTQLNAIRPNSAVIIQAELTDEKSLQNLGAQIQNLDVLVNNASVFYPTPFEDATQQQWNEILNTNLSAPFFLAQALTRALRKNRGCIINIVDIHSERPLKNHPIYNISKAGLKMLTQTLGKELAPEIRVCGVSPGSILWPENEGALDAVKKNKMLKKIALRSQGSASDIADAVLFLAGAKYITGQILCVDGGRTLNQ